MSRIGPGPISVAVERGGLVEARHRVHAVVIAGGEIAAAAGDHDLVAFLRSAAKPFQALPVLEAQPDLPDDELAIACASHVARPEQLAAVRSLLARASAGEDDLECGPERGSRLRHPCSGKHAAMLLLARARGWETTGYRLPEHPVQREGRRAVAAATGVPEADLPTAVDGCGVTTFAVRLAAAALAFSRLASDELVGGARVRAAMRAHPELVGGPGVVDTELMRALPGAVAKRGAEGLLCLGLPDGRGVALKAEDGSDRAVGPAAAHVLGLADLARPEVRNSHGEAVGSLFTEP